MTWSEILNQESALIKELMTEYESCMTCQLTRYSKQDFTGLHISTLSLCCPEDPSREMQFPMSIHLLVVLYCLCPPCLIPPLQQTRSED